MPLRYQIELPIAPSINALWGKGNGRVYRSHKYQKWLKTCDGLFMASGLNKGLKTIWNPYRLQVELPETMRPDLDNVGSKAISDWLQHVKIIKNDNLCRRLGITAGNAPKGYCIVTVEEL